MNLPLLMAGAALAVLAVGDTALGAEDGAAHAQAFLPPSNPMILTRTVWRTLNDGKQIVVKRRYRVSFASRGDGFRLDGQFLDASVEAPPMLMAMAELERQRADQVPFPILLDPVGRIRQNNGAGNDNLARFEALRRGKDLIERSALSSEERGETGLLLEQLALQRATSTWPTDLFNPALDQRSEHRRLALPDGQEGGIDVSISVARGASAGLPEAVERTVVTELGGTRQQSRERWSFELASPNRR
jgi:hypothetical protein